MKNLPDIFLSAIFLLLTVVNTAPAASSQTGDGSEKTVSSASTRAVLLELYTSEGCSSCPPAEQFMSELKQAGISDRQLIPMAFHVTYWDGIGWKDPYAKPRYDQRQRALAEKNRQKSVYTPQFVLSGKDYRSYGSFSDDVTRLSRQTSPVALVLGLKPVSLKSSTGLQINLRADIKQPVADAIVYYLAVLENNLVSNVTRGENQGKQLHHDYVVRQLIGPFRHKKTDSQEHIRQQIAIPPEWNRQQLSIVAFAQDAESGEILQAVRLAY